MKYKVPRILKSEILIIEIDNTKNDVNMEQARDFFRKNNVANLTEFESPYEIKFKTAIRTPACSIECASNPKEFKIPNRLDQILVFKNIY